MDYYDIYGVNLPLNQVEDRLNQVLSIDFLKKESSFFGEYLFSGDREAENIEIKSNIDLTDGEPLKPEFSMYSTLIFINCTTRPEFIRQLIEGEGIKRLSHNGYV